MKMPKKALLFDRFRQACLSLNGQKRVVIVHHSDTDGLCSALVAAKAIEKISGKAPEHVIPFDYGDDEADKIFSEKIKKLSPDTLFVLDVNIDSREKLLKALGKEAGTLVVIDHHKIYRDWNSEKIVFLKAQYFRKMDGSRYANAKFTFDLFGRIVELEEMGWAACIGILGDNAYYSWKKFFEKTLPRAGISLVEIKKIAKLIEAVEAVRNSEFQNLFWEMFRAKSPKSILGSEYFDVLETYERILEKWREKFEREHSFDKELELMHYAIKPEYQIKSPLINTISNTYRHRTIVIFEEYDGRIGFSARRQDYKIKLNDLLAKSIIGIPESAAGGHVPAAAGSIPKKYYSKFLESLKKNLAKEYK